MFDPPDGLQPPAAGEVHSFGGGPATCCSATSVAPAEVAVAEAARLHWAFTLSNAAGSHAEFRFRLGDLSDVNWDAVMARQWRGLKDPKQAEFLVHRYVPWSLIERIGVMNRRVEQRVSEITAGTAIRVEALPEWYY